MFHKLAFANSLAILVALFYIIFYVVSLVAPAVFDFVFNAQFFGADVASLMPQQSAFIDFLSTLVVLVVTTWIMAYVWAWLYNKFAK